MLVLFKGAGDLATAAARRLHLMDFQIVMTELPQPLCIRRKVSFAESVYASITQVEEVRAERASSVEAIRKILSERSVVVIVDPDGTITASLPRSVLIDARMLRRPNETNLDEAPIVIGLGPGLVAGKDVHAVIETNRGHNLGRVLYEGTAVPSTGIPGDISGVTTARMMRAPTTGRFETCREIGDHVEIGDPIASVDDHVITAGVAGIIRGLLHPGVHIRTGVKVADIDPRDVREYCFTISDKANAVAGGVVEACCSLLRNR